MSICKSISSPRNAGCARSICSRVQCRFVGPTSAKERISSQNHPNRYIGARAEDEETKVAVADAMKSGVRAIAWTIDGVTDFAYKYAPNDMDRNLVGLIVKVLAAFTVLSIAQNVLSFALTLGTIAVLAVVAVNVLKLDVDDILDAAKTKK